MKVLVTGANGLVGRAVAAALAGRHELRLLDRTGPPPAGSGLPAASGTGSAAPSSGPAAVPAAPAGAPGGSAGALERAEFVRADITDPDAMRKACEGMEAVIHLAALVSGDPARGVEIFRVNALGTFVALDAARLAGVRRFLCASSINATGMFAYRISGRPPDHGPLPMGEDFPCAPEDPYSLAKLANEHTCAAFYRAWGIETAAFRIAGVWSAAEYAKALARGPSPTTAWSDSLYNWVHVEDVAACFLLALEAPEIPGFGVYNLCAADTTRPEPTMDLLRRFRPDLAAKIREPLPGRASLISIARAARTFGYAPRFRLGP
ncbi:MAG: NAD(P)-dependent oxidoreductase [Planctomycetota bacterium]|nr:NAD(P)-dependent oxidoreductase [Planctomycetota bacterium]